MLEAFVASFVAIALAEFADKTQLASMVLAARFSELFPVFLGVMLALGMLTAMAIICGKRVFRSLPEPR